MLIQPRCWAALASPKLRAWILVIFPQAKSKQKESPGQTSPFSPAFLGVVSQGSSLSKQRLLTQFEGLGNYHVRHWDNRAKCQDPWETIGTGFQCHLCPHRGGPGIPGRPATCHPATLPSGFRAPWSRVWYHRGRFLVFLWADVAKSSSEWQLSCRKLKQPWILRRRHVVLFGTRPQALSGKEVLKQLQKFQIKDQEFRGSILK